MTLSAAAILAVWNDVDPAFEDDFNAWYLREHIPERTAVPGMLRGRRYRADAGAPRYMAFYEAETMDVLTRGAYRRQLDNPTEWTQRVMARFRFAQRGLCDVIASVGGGMGGAAAVVHMVPEDEHQLRKWIIESLLPWLQARSQVTAAHLWALAPGEATSATAAMSERAEPDHPIAWVLVVETMEYATAETVAAAILERDPAAHGAALVRPYPVYRLLYASDPSV